MLCALGMVLIAFGGQGRFWRTSVIFLAVSAAFGGAVWAISMLFYGFRPGGLYIPVSLPMLAVSFALCYAAVTLVFRRIGERAERCLRRVEITLGARHAEFTALEDTGNGLYDPLTGRSALVAEAEVLRDLFPNLPESVLKGAPADAVLRIPGARLLPYADVSGKNRLLPAFRPDRVTVDGQPRDDLIAAAAPSSLGGGGSYQALL